MAVTWTTLTVARGASVTLTVQGHSGTSVADYNLLVTGAGEFLTTTTGDYLVYA